MILETEKITGNTLAGFMDINTKAQHELGNTFSGMWLNSLAIYQIELHYRCKVTACIPSACMRFPCSCLPEP